MAGDWIKMRVWLAKDPKVIAIADFLSDHRPFMDWMTNPLRRTCDTSVYEHVTRDVTVRVTVTGLLQTWGVTRTDGHKEGDDLIIDMTDPTALDEIAGFPGLGEALEFVGWAVYDAENHRTIFPKFFLHNASTDELKKQKDAERKRLQRQRKSGLSTDCPGTRPPDCPANVTPREEKRRDIIPPTPFSLLNPFDTPEVQTAFADWFAYVTKAGKQPVDPAQAAAAAVGFFRSPAELLASMRFAKANGYVTLKRYDEAVASESPTPDEEELPYVDLPRAPKPRRDSRPAAVGATGRTAGGPSHPGRDTGASETN